MSYVYLVGAITEDPITREWRRTAIKKLRHIFEIIDPTASKFDKELLKESKEDSKEFYRRVAQKESEILLPKSYGAVEKATIILANFSLEPKDRPMVGSLFEIAWAWQLHKTIIAIKGNNYYSFHPMILGAVNAWADDLDEACEIIIEFFDNMKGV